MAFAFCGVVWNKAAISAWLSQMVPPSACKKTWLARLRWRRGPVRRRLSIRQASASLIAQILLVLAGLVVMAGVDEHQLAVGGSYSKTSNNCTFSLIQIMRIGLSHDRSADNRTSPSRRGETGVGGAMRMSRAAVDSQPPGRFDAPAAAGIIDETPLGRHSVLIKPADDKSKRLALLEDLQKSPLLDRRQREWLRDELFRTKRGIAGERDAAHYLNNYLKDDPDRVVLHDLRFKVDGDVVQIDHMVITRALYVYLLETKNFNGNLHINEHGEFAVEYSGERLYGIPSPLEQSRRHEGPLRKLFDLLEVCGRNGRAPVVEHCVLVSPASIIHRPSAKLFDTTNVIKADQFRAWHEKFVESAKAPSLVSSLLNIRSASTVEEFARKLVRQHRPADLLALPEFMQPRQAPVQAAQAAQVVRAVRAVEPAPVASAVQRKAALGPASPPVPAAEPIKATERRKLICATCAGKISFAEGRFCWNNERRFGGQQYCREHQVAFC
jgi:hypothetical protein